MQSVDFVRLTESLIRRKSGFLMLSNVYRNRTTISFVKRKAEQLDVLSRRTECMGGIMLLCSLDGT